MKKLFSKRYRLNWYDATKAIGLFFITTLADVALQGLMMWQADHAKPIDFKEMLITAGIATFSYLVRSFLTVPAPQAVEHAAKEAGIINHK